MQQTPPQQLWFFPISFFICPWATLCDFYLFIIFVVEMEATLAGKRHERRVRNAEITARVFLTAICEWKKKEKNLLCLWNIHVFWKLILPSCIYFSFSSYSSFSISVVTPPFHDKMRRQRSARWCLQLHVQNIKGSLWFERVFEIAEIHVTLHSYILKKKATVDRV